jgi:hypothetical protein
MLPKYVQKNFMVGFWILIVCGFVILGYGSWMLARKINYSWAYKDLVKETIREVVKPECLNLTK